MDLLNNGNFRLVLPSSVEFLEEVDEVTSRISKECHFSDSIADDLSICVTELFNNAIHHGNKDDETKKVTILYKLISKGLEITISDEGDGYNPDDITDPLDPDNLLASGGRGIFLVKKLMNRFEVRRNDTGVKTIITKYY